LIGVLLGDGFEAKFKKLWVLFGICLKLTIKL